jgi:ankyrin repeat protein
LTRLLVENGADLSVPCQDIKGYPPLQILMSRSKPDIELIKILLEKGAPVNQTNDSGQTALHLAAFWGWYCF